MAETEEDIPSCGKGLAAHAPLPLVLADLIGAIGHVLAAHIPSLDRSDPATEEERAAYSRLTEEHRAIASQLRSLGEAMSSYADLPMGRHDMSVLLGQNAVESFRTLVKVEQGLAALLDRRLVEDLHMLEAIDAEA